MAKQPTQPTIATLDFETDPFAGPGHPVTPFCAGFYDGLSFISFWGDNCVAQIADYIRRLDRPYIIYAHNGGRFDFLFMVEHLEPNLFCIGSRVVQAYIRGNQFANGPSHMHELRDSFAILPVPLTDAAEKFKFDYAKMTRGQRNRHRAEIIEYLEQDCIGLYDTVKLYRQEFGNALTMASAAHKALCASMLKTYTKMEHVYDRLRPHQDIEMRPWYFGGRVECFKRGIIDANVTLFDINSSYPHVMRNYLHPVSNSWRKSSLEITNQTDFAIIDAFSDRALPLRDPYTGSLNFPYGRCIFHATGHEIRTGIALGIVKIFKVFETLESARRIDFQPFVDCYHYRRIEAKHRGDKTFSLFWKLVLNSAYGKFAQNPLKFRDTRLVFPDDVIPDEEEGWEISERHAKFDVYTRPTYEPSDKSIFRHYLNVSTAASITGAARAELLRGLCSAENVVYCDTDSIIAERLPVALDDMALGGWKAECTGNRIAVVEKKTYALFGEPCTDAVEHDRRIRQWGDGRCVKLASKGVRASAQQILDAAAGSTISITQEVPTLHLDGSQSWITRRIAMRSTERDHVSPGKG